MAEERDTGKSRLLTAAHPNGPRDRQIRRGTDEGPSSDEESGSAARSHGNKRTARPAPLLREP